MKKLFRWLLPCFGLRMSFGSESNASTSNATEVRDMRVVGGDSSANISANNSDVTVMQTDHGAVTGGYALASQAVTGVVANGDNLLERAGSMFTSALNFADNQTQKVANAYGAASDRQSAAFSNSLGEVASAWAESKAPDLQTFKWAGIAVAAVAAIALLAPRLKG